MFVSISFGFTALAILLILWRGGLLKTKGYLFAACALTLVAVLTRNALLDSRSGDYNSFLVKWVQFFRDNGGFRALSQPVGDYNLPYLYFMALFSYLPVNDLHLIKMLSVVFDVLLAYFALCLCGLFTTDKRRLLAVFFGTLMLPTVFINSAWWAQCDSIYVAFALGALYFALKKRPVLSVMFATLSFAFKLQAIFFLPIYAVLLMSGHIKWRHLLYVPLFFVLCILPAVIAGRPFMDSITIYVNQTSTYSGYLTLNAPSWFAFFPARENIAIMSYLGILFAFAYMLTLFGFAWKHRAKLDNSLIVMLTLALSVGIPFLLPSMHERYFYIAEVLAVVCLFSGLVNIIIPFLVQLSTLICYVAYMRNRYLLPLSFCAAVMAFAFALTVNNTLKSISKKEVLDDYSQKYRPHIS